MGMNILFLNGLEPRHGAAKLRMLQDIYGQKRVRAPDLKTNRMVTIFALLFGFIILSLLGTVIGVFVGVGVVAGSITLGCALGAAALLYLIGTRLLSFWMVKYGVFIAQRSVTNFHPNLIVATSFGAVVGFSLKCPKMPLLLFAPAQDSYARYLHRRDLN